jgi:hypothetical protein
MTDTPLESAWCLLKNAVMTLVEGRPVGTVAARDPQAPAADNYEECFVRDFAVSGLVHLADGNAEVVRNFLTTIVRLLGQELTMAGHEIQPGVMPASFRRDSGQIQLVSIVSGPFSGSVSKAPEQEVDRIHDLIPLQRKREQLLTQGVFRNSGDLLCDHYHLDTFDLELWVEVPGGLTTFGQQRERNDDACADGFQQIRLDFQQIGNSGRAVGVWIQTNIELGHQN